MLYLLLLWTYKASVTMSLDEQTHSRAGFALFHTSKISVCCRMSDASLEEEDSSGELSNLPNIGTAPIPEVEAVLRTADHWHFDAFKLTEASQGYPLSTLGFWLIQQNRVAKEFSESTPSPPPPPPPPI